MEREIERERERESEREIVFVKKIPEASYLHHFAGVNAVLR